MNILSAEGFLKTIKIYVKKDVEGFKHVTFFVSK